MVLTGDTQVLGEILSQCHFVHPNLTWTDLGSNPDLRGEIPASNRLSHGTASVGRAHGSSWHACGVFWTSDRLS
jgi:hypothetical protein